MGSRWGSLGGILEEIQVAPEKFVVGYKVRPKKTVVDGGTWGPL